MIQHCPFCDKSVHARTFASNDHAIAIVARHAVKPGQSLVVPKRHVETLSGLQIHELNNLFSLCKSASNTIRRFGDYSGINLVINDGPDAGQTIPHLHIHIIPRVQGDTHSPKHWLSDELFDLLREIPNEDIIETGTKLNIIHNNILLKQTDTPLPPNCTIEPTAVIAPGTLIGENSYIGHNVIIGTTPHDYLDSKISIGKNATIRSGTTIYNTTRIGENFDCGHNVTIRSGVSIGNNCYVMPNTQIHNNCSIGNDVRLAGFLCNRATVGNRCSSLGLLVHDYRTKKGGSIEDSPTILDGSVIGMNSIIIGGVTIGENSYIGAGSVVDRSVCSNTFLKGPRC